MNNTFTSIVRRLVPAALRRELRRLYAVSPESRGTYLRHRVQRLRGLESKNEPIRRPGTVLFVCHGNIMRSALAHEILAGKLRGLGEQKMIVMSAGTHATSGQPADPRMRAAAAALGLSLESHRASLVSESMITLADVIFAMDYLNEAELLTRYPSALPKVRLLGSYSPSTVEGEEILDPFTESNDSAGRCASRIAACIDAFATDAGIDANTHSQQSAPLPARINEAVAR